MSEASNLRLAFENLGLLFAIPILHVQLSILGITFHRDDKCLDADCERIAGLTCVGPRKAQDQSLLHSIPFPRGRSWFVMLAAAAFPGEKLEFVVLAVGLGLEPVDIVVHILQDPSTVIDIAT